VSKAEESRWEQNECSLSLSLSAICSSFPVQLSAFWALSRSPLPIEESRGSRQPTREGGKSTALRFRLVDFRKIEGKRKKKLSTADVNSNNQTPKTVRTMLERVEALVLDLKLQRVGERRGVVEHSDAGH
jgi:hypothetical protein